MFTQEVINIVCVLKSVAPEEIASSSRDAGVVAARKIITAICTEYKVSNREIASLFGYTRNGVQKLLAAHKASMEARDMFAQRYIYDYARALEEVREKLILPALASVERKTT